MARIDRRNRLALDESLRYYRKLESGAAPELFQLAHSLNNVASGLSQAQGSQFKLTQQLWRRLQEALFDAYLTNFVGTISIRDAAGRALESGQSWPEDGIVFFRPQGCKRAEDSAQLPIKRLYPGTYSVIKELWKVGATHVEPALFEGASQCQEGVCAMRPVVLGSEVLQAESSAGKQVAYQQWWELYWQAYCTPNRQQRSLLYRSMMSLESVWGDLYY